MQACAKVVGRMSGDAGALPDCRDADDNRSHRLSCVQLLLGLSRRIGWPWEGLDTGRHEKTPVCCPCSRLSALHGDPPMLLLM